MAAISASLFWWNTGRHWSLGLRSTKYSVLKKPVVSVPSSGRPNWLTTCVTSGNEARMMRAWFITRSPSVGPVLGASVARAQMAPSSRCGRNSEPIAPLRREIRRDRQCAPAPRPPSPSGSGSRSPAPGGTAAVIHVISGFRHSRHVLRRTGSSIAPARSPSRRAASPTARTITVHAIGLNSRPSTRCSVKIGR